MNLRASRIPNSLLSFVLAGIASFALGCIIVAGDGDGDTDGSSECGDLLDHNHLEGNTCYCDSGYEWCQPNNLNNFECCEKPGKPPGTGAECGNHSSLIDGECFCDDNYTWCSDSGLDCCAEDPKGTDSGETTDSGTGSGTTAGPVECDSAEPPPDGGCTDGEFWCTHPSDCGPNGSEYYFCDSGSWMLIPQSDLDAECQLEDPSWMAFGCVDNAELQQVDLVCGNGSGEVCGADSCENDGVTLYACDYGIHTANINCQAVCENTEDPDTQEFYDLGECGDQGDGAQCLCSFEGGGTSTGGGSTGGSTGGGGSSTG